MKNHFHRMWYFPILLENCVFHIHSFALKTCKKVVLKEFRAVIRIDCVVHIGPKIPEPQSSFLRVQRRVRDSAAVLCAAYTHILFIHVPVQVQVRCAGEPNVMHNC
jgi:hypothetical protein